MDTQSLLALRQQKDDFFKNHPQSPLTPEQQAHFTGLSYYEPNPALDLSVTVTRFPQQQTIQMQTSTGGVQDYIRYGEFTFTVDGQEVRLTLFLADYGFFLPFVDAGAGTETYPAGRYLEPDHLGGEHFQINLNDAYNPYCAYNDAWTCPIPPAENRLAVHIRAGEKLPQDEWVNHG